MADVALKTYRPKGKGVSVVNPSSAWIFPHIAAAAITAGQPVYVNVSGLVDLASSAAGGTKQFRGIALQSVGTRQAVAVLYEGVVYGYDLEGLAHDALVYLSDTPGALATAAGSNTVQVGRVHAWSDPDQFSSIRKALLVRARLESDW